MALLVPIAFAIVQAGRTLRGGSVSKFNTCYQCVAKGRAWQVEECQPLLSSISHSPENNWSKCIVEDASCYLTKTQCQDMEKEKVEAIACESKTKCETCTSTAKCVWKSGTLVGDRLVGDSSCMHESSINDVYFVGSITAEIIRTSDTCPDNTDGFKPIVQKVPGVVCPLNSVAPWHKCIGGPAYGNNRRGLSCVGRITCESSCTKHGFECVQLQTKSPVWNTAGACCPETLCPHFECKEVGNEEPTASEAKEAEEAESHHKEGSQVPVPVLVSLSVPVPVPVPVPESFESELPISVSELLPEVSNEQRQQISVIQEEIPLTVSVSEELTPDATVNNNNNEGGAHFTGKALQAPTYDP